MTVSFNRVTPAVNNEPLKLGEYLVQQGTLTRSHLQRALLIQKSLGGRLGDILVAEQFISRDQLQKAVLDLNPTEISVESEVVHYVSPDVFVRTKSMILALNEDKREVYIATAANDKRSVEAEFREYFHGYKVIFGKASYQMIENYHRIIQMETKTDTPEIDKVLNDAIARRASDIHLVPGAGYTFIQYRIDGDIRPVATLLPEAYKKFAAALKDRANADMAEKRIPQDGRFSTGGVGANKVDFRLATLPGYHGETLVVRILDPNANNKSLDELDIDEITEWKKGIHRKDGLCLICGPTGSGKTTTARATLQYLDPTKRNVLTIEDPIEFEIVGATQLSVNQRIGMTFAAGVKAFMRSDPDIIFIGEIRDQETAMAAAKAAKTGHIVIASLHTSSIVETVSRLEDLGIPRYDVAAMLRVVLVQGLIKKKCTNCGGHGCELCDFKGTRGRRMVSECAYFPDDTQFNRLLNKEVWWKTMLDSAIKFVEEGEGVAEEVVSMFGDVGLVGMHKRIDGILLEKQGDPNVREYIESRFGKVATDYFAKLDRKS